MVQAAGDVGGVQRLAAPHLPERLEAGADDVRGGLVHAEEDRVVVGAQPDRSSRAGRCGRRAATASISAGVVDGGDLVERGACGAGTTRSRAAGDAELGGQPHRQVDPDRAIGCVRPEVVLGQRRVEDHRRRPGALHGSRTVACGLC